MILFDIDGTLLHTGGCGRIAFENAFEELFQVKDSWGDLVPDGKTDPVIIEEITARTLKRRLKASEYRELCDRYHHHFRIAIQNPPKFKLMPGVKTLLKKLEAERGLYLGIATGNFEEAAWMKLERGNIHSFFKFGGFASDSADRTELTEKAFLRGEKMLGRKADRGKTVLIGDTPLDVAVGKKLGFKTIGVATGRTGCKEFLRLGADHALEDLTNAEGFLALVPKG